MSKIDNIIDYSNAEIIRAKIASILADELSNQLSLNETALTLEESQITPNQSLIEFYTLNIECIPTTVFEERFTRINNNEYPVINVVFSESPLELGTSNSRQNTTLKFVIECYQQAHDSENENGDKRASLLLIRLLHIVRSIIMNRNYIALGFDESPFIVSRREVSNITIAEPPRGADATHNDVFGKLDIMVVTTEETNDLSGVALIESFTDVRINDTEKGYYWLIENN